MLGHGFSDRLIKIRTEEYNLQRTILNEHLKDALLKREAQSRNLSVEDLLSLEVRDRVGEPSEPEIQEARAAQKSSLGEISESLGLAVGRERLLKQRRSIREAQFVASLQAKYGVRILMQPPRIDFSSLAGPTKGPQSAEITILEYSDFQCPFCKQAQAVLSGLQTKYPGKVKLVFKQFPLSVHRDAERAAEAAVCASDQNHFWELHDVLFAHEDLSLQALEAYARQIGLNEATFFSCMSSHDSTMKIRNDIESGVNLGINSTPTFFVNGRLVVGAASIERIVEDEFTIDDRH